MTRHPLTPTRPILPAAGAALAAALCVAVLGMLGFFLAFPPIAWFASVDAPYPADPRALQEIALESIRPLLQAHGFWDRLDALLQIPGNLIGILHGLDLGAAITIRLGAIALAALVCGGAVYSLIRANSPSRQAVRHIAGPMLRAGRQASRMLQANWQRRFGREAPGIALAPGLVMPRSLEAEHILLVGGTGSGKTTILQSLMDGALRQGDRLLVLDVKGELTARLPTDSFLLLAMGDARGADWRLGRDIVDENDATELAMELITETSDPAWSGGARRILAGLIRHLQQGAADSGLDWGWRDLDQLLMRPIGELHGILTATAPECALFLDVTQEATRKQALSFYLVLIANAGQAVRAAVRMGRDGAPSFSIRDWVASPESAQVLILQQAQRAPLLSGILARIVLKLIADAAVDLAAKTHIPPLWLFLDELPQIGKSDSVPRLAAIGRSGGIRVVAAIQSPSQLDHVYGHDQAQELLDNLTTKIVGRVAAGKTAQEIAERWIGTRKVEYWLRTGSDAKGRPQVKHCVEDIPVVRPDDLSEHLGLRRDAIGNPVIRALVLGHGDVCQFHWPIGIWRERRPASSRRPRRSPPQ